jgi:UDP-glucose 6-dehydrogenase
MKIGFIGQGFVGKNIANDFERRGFEVVRYALEEEYKENKDQIALCDIVFIAVPTPTTSLGFDYCIVDESLRLVGDGKIAVIKSTILPGTADTLQKKHPDLVILFSPEFLCESTAAHDAANPMFNIIGIDPESAGHRTAAETVMNILPKSKHSFIIATRAAELFKYAHNIHGFMRVILSNILYDLANAIKADWSEVEAIMNVDPMMSPYYNAPIHKSGRGAGGHCFIKDMAAFARMYAEILPSDSKGREVLRTLELKNLELLKSSGKDTNIVREVYGSVKA